MQRAERAVINRAFGGCKRGIEPPLIANLHRHPRAGDHLGDPGALGGGRGDGLLAEGRQSPVHSGQGQFRMGWGGGRHDDAVGNPRCTAARVNSACAGVAAATTTPSTQAERWQDGLPITGAPLYYNGLVIAGFAGGDRATRGRLKAFDAKSGHLEWTFYTVPGPGEFGHETWPQDTMRGSGGA